MRPSILAFLAIALMVLSSSISTAQKPPPKALVVLVERGGMGMPIGPLPVGVRFVLYDDGEILFRLPRWREQGPQFQAGVLSASQTEDIRREIADWISGPEPTLTGDRSWTDQGNTSLDVWDTQQQRYRTMSTYGTPCLDPSASKSAGSQDRNLTDPRLLKACDWLLQYRVINPTSWTPDGVEVVVGIAEEPPGQIYDWPEAELPRSLKPNTYVSHCIASTALPSDLFHHMLTSNPGRDRQLGFRLPDKTFLTIVGWSFDLPGGVPQFKPDGGIRAYLGRSCSKS